MTPPTAAVYLSNPERGVRFAAQLIEAVVDSSLEHAVLKEADEGSRGADWPPGVVESDVYVGVLLLLVHKGAQPWLTVGGQLIPAAGQSLHSAKTELVQLKVFRWLYVTTAAAWLFGWAKTTACCC